MAIYLNNEITFNGARDRIHSSECAKIAVPFIDHRVSIVVVYERRLMLRCNRYTANCNSWCGIAGQYVSGRGQFSMAVSQSGLINDWSVDCNATNFGLIEVTFPGQRNAICYMEQYASAGLRGKDEHCLECIRILGVCYIDLSGVN